MVLCRRTACAVTRAGHVPARQRQNDPGGGASRSTGAVHILSDVVRKELAHLAPGEPRSEAFGKGLYAPTMTRRPYAALIRRASHCLRLGLRPQLRAAFIEPTEMEDVISVSSGEAPSTAVSQAMSALANVSRRGPWHSLCGDPELEACTFVIEATRDASWRPV